MVGVGLNIVDSGIVFAASLYSPIHPSYKHWNNALADDARCAEPNLCFRGMRAEEFTNEVFHLLAQGAEVFSCHLAKQAGRAGEFPQDDEEFVVVGIGYPAKKGLDPSP